MRRCRAAPAFLLAAVVSVAVGGSACGDGADDDAFAETLCPAVQAWSDATADTVEAFREDSRGLDSGARRVRYRRAFDELTTVRQRLIDVIDELDPPDAVADRLGAALETAASITAAGIEGAEALPDAAYQLVAVREGKLMTGFEKARVTVYYALADLAADETTGVPRGCGRRDRLDFSPSVTFPD